MAIHLAKLSDLTRLHSLWCFGINGETLSHVCGCPSLKNLYIDKLRCDKVGCVREFRSLRVLSLSNCPMVSSLNELSSLTSLEALSIIIFRNVHNIDPLSRLANLRQLAVAGSIWTRMKLKSLRPLSSLQNLRYLNLTSLKAEDESLSPLAALERLEVNDFFLPSARPPHRLVASGRSLQPVHQSSATVGGREFNR